MPSAFNQNLQHSPKYLLTLNAVINVAKCHAVDLYLEKNYEFVGNIFTTSLTADDWQKENDTRINVAEPEICTSLRLDWMQILFIRKFTTSTTFVNKINKE